MKCKSVTYFQWRKRRGDGVILASFSTPLPSSFITASPTRLASEPRRGERLNPAPTVRKQVSGEATVPGRGLRSCPRFIFRHFERHKQPSREKALSVFLDRFVILTAPSPRTCFRSFFFSGHLSPPLNFKTRDILYICFVQWLSGES